jgi:hypothetical protein
MASTPNALDKTFEKAVFHFANFFGKLARKSRKCLFLQSRKRFLPNEKAPVNTGAFHRNKARMDEAYLRPF